MVTLQVTVPLCFSEGERSYAIQAPEKVAITIKGKRSDIYALDKKSLAAHINIAMLLPGKHGIVLTEQHFFLTEKYHAYHL